MPLCEPDPLHKAVGGAFQTILSWSSAGSETTKLLYDPNISSPASGAEKAFKGGGLLLLCLEHSFACQTPRPFFPECDAVDGLSKEGFYPQLVFALL